jgi:Protein of unknown function (DUF2802)
VSNWTLVQIIFNLVTVASIAALWMRLRRPPQDDPRLSRGLQLLQTKITVLEDLSDRTDSQVRQLTQLLDQKNRLLQNRILEAEQQMVKIDHSMHKSMEVAEIFQDKIPHHEIAERQRTVEYVKAARMANSGLSVDQIVEAVHLPREQVELIAKFNRDQLMFDESALPEWAARGVANEEVAGTFGMGEMDFVSSLETRPNPDLQQMARIDSDFKAAVRTAKEIEANPMPTLLDNKVADVFKSGVSIGASAISSGISTGVHAGSQHMQTGIQHMQPAVNTVKATAQTLKERLVSTAEELLKAQASTSNSQATYQGTRSSSSSSVKPPGTEVQRIKFPRIEK